MRNRMGVSETKESVSEQQVVEQSTSARITAGLSRTFNDSTPGQISTTPSASPSVVGTITLDPVPITDGGFVATSTTFSGTPISDERVAIALKREEAKDLADVMNDIGVPKDLVCSLRDLTHKWNDKKAELKSFTDARTKRYKKRSAEEQNRLKSQAKAEREAHLLKTGEKRLTKKGFLEDELKKLGESKDKVFSELKLQVLSKGIPNADAVTQALLEAEEAIAHLRDEIIELERKVETKAAELKRPPDRPLRCLEDDVMNSDHWMTDPRPNMVVRDQLQRLTSDQQNIADGKPGFTTEHEHARVDTYFMYRQASGQAVMMQKISEVPVRWEIKYYYEMSSLERVRQIFKFCDWRSEELRNELLPIKPVSRTKF